MPPSLRDRFQARRLQPGPETACAASHLIDAIFLRRTAAQTLSAELAEGKAADDVWRRLLHHFKYVERC